MTELCESLGLKVCASISVSPSSVFVFFIRPQGLGHFLPRGPWRASCCRMSGYQVLSERLELAGFLFQVCLRLPMLGLQLIDPLLLKHPAQLPGPFSSAGAGFEGSGFCISLFQFCSPGLVSGQGRVAPSSAALRGSPSLFRSKYSF